MIGEDPKKDTRGQTTRTTLNLVAVTIGVHLLNLWSTTKGRDSYIIYRQANTSLLLYTWNILFTCCSLKVRPPLPMDGIKTADCASDGVDTARYTDSILIIPWNDYCNIRSPKIWVILIHARTV